MAAGRDGRRNRVLIGDGDGALAVIDPAQKKKVSGIPLKAHPEAFQLAPGQQDLRQCAGRRQIAEVARVPTVSGARTSLFVPELDRLYVAARSTFSEPTAIWVLRPMP